MARLSDEVLSSLIGDIYDCALDRAAWTPTLTRVNAVMNGACAWINLCDNSPTAWRRGVRGHYRVAEHSPWDREALCELADWNAREDLPGMEVRLFRDIDTPISVLSQTFQEEFERTPFFREWVARHAIRDGCAVKFAQTPDRIGMFSFVVHSTRDIISAEERRFLALLSPHLRRAALIGDLLDQTRVVLETYKTALDTLTVPVMLISAAGRIEFANAAAEAVFSQKDAPLRVRQRMLAMRAVWATGALRDTIARSAADQSSLGARGIAIPVSHPGEAPCVAYVLPLKKGATGSALGQAVAAVFLSTGASAHPPAEATLTTLYDLTPTEARVLLQIGAGHTPDGAAIALGVSVNTVKTHLARVFSKTETTRQAELVKLVDSLALPVATPAHDASGILPH